MIEWLAIALSGGLSLIAPAGTLAEQQIETEIRDRAVSVEMLAVRVDRRPSYSLLSGEVDRFSLASRGLEIISQWRLAVFELETDPIALSLSPSPARSPLNALHEPLTVGVRVVLTEADLSEMLRSPQAQAPIRALLARLQQSFPSARGQRYELLAPEIDLLEGNRWRLRGRLRVSRPQIGEWREFALDWESGVRIDRGRQLQLLDPQLRVDGRPFAPRQVRGLSQRLSQRFDLDRLLPPEITARLLQVAIADDKVELAAIVRADPSGNKSR